MNSWHSWGQPCVAVLAGAPKGIICVVVWFGSRNRAGAGLSRVIQGVTEGCISLCAGCCSVITQGAEQQRAPFPHLLLYVRLRIWVISPTAGSCWHIKMSFLMFWHMLDGLRLPLWSGKSVLRPCFYEDLFKAPFGWSRRYVVLPAPAWTRIGGIFWLSFAAKLKDNVFLLNVILKNLASQLDGLVGDSSVIAAKKCSAPAKLTDW